ncbi:uncharacterized protein PHACADRAFT_186434 [Phanerochaete carnosa HHB-10118-sp]|uniref:Uncharacterized protein n=1 Tax=Phanerochaete carnosa (strain HHB-10118-sp) TaxID=650164 RepID=K5VLG1_PHACS|nr:uncharacterized protein PHACADRAFT_186434 [Phanerochaete carnosa HHB-10118-sp]EKM52253.1 hypothetical protein PHACADRAFT_186434 [Phanerochaete carnosa HHB-10118-sp]
MAIFTWAVVYRDYFTNIYNYLARLEDVDTQQKLGTIVEKVFADRNLRYTSLLARHGDDEFVTRFYQLPDWPCPRNSPSGPAKRANCERRYRRVRWTQNTYGYIT